MNAQFEVNSKGQSTVLYGDGKTLTAHIKPLMSFSYDRLRYTNSEKFYVIGDETIPLSNDQIDEIEQYISTITENKEATKMVADNRLNLQFLHSTDWYVVRFLETGVPIPEEISLKRAEARANIKYEL
jgi:hypothetical protein